MLHAYAMCEPLFWQGCSAEIGLSLGIPLEIFDDHISRM